jgi:hypothetical protein
VQSLGYTWLANQFSIPATHGLTERAGQSVFGSNRSVSKSLWFNTWWQQSITAPDQLRQRVAFALSEIFVVSENGTLQNHADALSSYYDMLLDNAFGNYRTAGSRHAPSRDGFVFERAGQQRGQHDHGSPRR